MNLPSLYLATYCFDLLLLTEIEKHEPNLHETENLVTIEPYCTHVLHSVPSNPRLNFRTFEVFDNH